METSSSNHDLLRLIGLLVATGFLVFAARAKGVSDTVKAGEAHHACVAAMDTAQAEHTTHEAMADIRSVLDHHHGSVEDVQHAIDEIRKSAESAMNALNKVIADECGAPVGGESSH